MEDLGGYELVKMLLVLGFVVLLMLGLAQLLKRLGLGDRTPLGKAKRLRIVESLPLDARRRLMIIARDGAEHLVICGPNSETIVETHIKAVQDNSNSDDHDNN